MKRLEQDSISIVSRDISMTYGDQKVLDLPGSVMIPEGLTVIQGSSGSGKSTWLNIMAGFVAPTNGEMQHVNDQQESLYSNKQNPGYLKRVMGSVAQMLLVQTPAEAKESRYRSENMGYIRQQPALHPELSLEKYIRLVHEVRGSQPDGDYVSSLIGQLGLLKLLGKKPCELSGGEEQRGAIVAALAHEPPVVLADEPTSALDHANKRNTMSILRDRANSGATVVVVSHDSVALDYADRIIRVDSGVIVKE